MNYIAENNSNGIVNQNNSASFSLYIIPYFDQNLSTITILNYVILDDLKIIGISDIDYVELKFNISKVTDIISLNVTKELGYKPQRIYISYMTGYHLKYWVGVEYNRI